jgi:hypothetical protein
MLKNWNHDLIHQLSEISDSLWRMDQYIKAAQDCERCRALWQELQAGYERFSKLLIEEIRKHAAENRFD